MTNSIKLINTNITGANGLLLLNSTFTYAWKNNTSEDPAESSYGNVESVFQGWENPQINLKFYLPINSNFVDGSTWLNWAKWNELVKNLYDGTSATATSLVISVGKTDTLFADYSASTSNVGVTSIPVVVKSYNLSFSPDDSHNSGFWTVSAQLSVTR